MGFWIRRFSGQRLKPGKCETWAKGPFATARPRHRTTHGIQTVSGLELQLQCVNGSQPCPEQAAHLANLEGAQAATFEFAAILANVNSTSHLQFTFQAFYFIRLRELLAPTYTTATMSITPIITFKAGMCDVDVGLPHSLPLHLGRALTEAGI